MAELHPEYLEELNATDEDPSKTLKSMQKELSIIPDWVQAYVAIMSRSQPQHVPSLMAYQHLVILPTLTGHYMITNSTKRLLLLLIYTGQPWMIHCGISAAQEEPPKRSMEPNH